MSFHDIAQDILIPAAAVYAAIVATLVLVWDIMKWKSDKTELTISANGKMKIGLEIGGSYFGMNAKQVADLDFMSIAVSNTGGKTTTITNVGMAVYRNRIMYSLNKPTVTYLLSLAIRGLPLPYSLEPGKQWSCVYQEDIEKRSKAVGMLCYIQISHSMSDKVATGRIKGW